MIYTEFPEHNQVQRLTRAYCVYCQKYQVNWKSKHQQQSFEADITNIAGDSGVGSGGQKLTGVVMHVIQCSVKQGIVGTYGIEDLTNIRIHIRGCMPKILVKGLVIQSHAMTNLLSK